MRWNASIWTTVRVFQRVYLPSDHAKGYANGGSNAANVVEVGDASGIVPRLLVETKGAWRDSHRA